MILLSKKEDYYCQTNDAISSILESYKASEKYVTCGISSFLCLNSILGNKLPKERLGISEEDYLMCYIYNPKNKQAIEKYMGFEDTPCIHEYIGIYPYLQKKLFNKTLELRKDMTAGVVSALLSERRPLMTAGDFSFGGHYVVFVGIDDEDNFIYNDPFKGRELKMTKAQFEEIFRDRMYYLC